MKVTLALTSLLFAFSQSSALSVNVHNSPDIVEAPAAECGDPRTMLPFLRAWNAALVDHFYTTNAAEMQNAVTNLGYVSEGTTGYIFSSQQPATVAFYRLYNPTVNDHFYTTSASERDNAIQNLGYNSEGTAGFIYPTNTTCSGLPLYRSYNGPGTDHFYTMSAAERDSAAAGGWAYEGIAGYMFPF
ncbi:hypothetical protein H0H92_004524 [Tricholoma furcatifolium]|nr:hypothetical protein H0H92_004524 [Tricholoma furcatifolium]